MTPIDKFIADGKAIESKATPRPWLKGMDWHGVGLNQRLLDEDFMIDARERLPKALEALEIAIRVFERYGCSMPNCGVVLSDCDPRICDICEARIAITKIVEQK